MLVSTLTTVLLLSISFEADGECVKSKYVLNNNCRYGRDYEECRVYDYTCTLNMLYNPHDISMPNGISGEVNKINLQFKNGFMEKFSEATIRSTFWNVITELKIYNSSLKNIELHAFGSLRALNLSYNQLEWMQPGALNELTEIDISHNSIKSLNSSLLELRNLVKLYISHNMISNISSGTFGSLQNLEYLDLSSNNISNLELGTLNGLGKLKSLNLFNNSIHTINNWMFHNTPKLEYLDIGYNFLDYMNVMEIINTTKLSKINLNGNTFECKDLATIMSTCRKLNIIVSQGTETMRTSLHGIECNFTNEGTTFTASNDETSTVQKFFDFDFKNSNFYKFFKNFRNTDDANDKTINRLADVLTNISGNSVGSLDNYLSKDFQNTKFYKFFDRNMSGSNDDLKIFYREFLRRENDEYLDSTVFRKFVSHDIQKLVFLQAAMLIIFVVTIIGSMVLKYVKRARKIVIKKTSRSLDSTNETESII